MIPIAISGILKFAALSDFFDQVLEGSIDISRASQNAKQDILKVPESERIQDDTQIGDGSYSGFNPHDGVSMDELMKYGMNPHAAGHPGAANSYVADHPGAANPHAGGSADTKSVTESTAAKSATTSSSSITEASFSMEESSIKVEPSASNEERERDASGTELPVKSSQTSVASVKGTESATERTKDEL